MGELREPLGERLDRLAAEGVIALSVLAQRPIAVGRPRPPSCRPVAGLVIEQRCSDRGGE